MYTVPLETPLVSITRSALSIVFRNASKLESVLAPTVLRWRALARVDTSMHTYQYKCFGGESRWSVSRFKIATLVTVTMLVCYAGQIIYYVDSQRVEVTGPFGFPAVDHPGLLMDHDMNE